MPYEQTVPEETVPYDMKKTVPYEQASLLFANGNDSAEEQARKAAARKEQDSSTPRELEWACLRLLNSLSHWGCSTKRRAVACALSGVVLASIMVALAATSLGQALAKSVTSTCTLTISVEGVAQCRRSHPRRHHTDLGFPIDAVYTWVDPTDLDWRERRHAAIGGTFGEFGANEPSDRAGYLSDARRFNNGEYPDAELCVSLELLQTRMPWIRHVWVLTMRPQRPTCTHPRMRVVHHDEVGLPDTFNAHSIETSVHKIPGLSEQFVYLNDDFYVLRPIPASTFFAADGRPFVWTEDLHFGQLFWRCEHACAVTNELVLPLLHGKRMLTRLHAPAALTISMLNATVSHPSLKAAVHETMLHLMRSDSDFIVFLAAQNLAVVWGTALLQTHNPRYVMVNGVPSAPFRRDHVVFACINNGDFDDREDVARLRAAFRLPHADTLNETERRYKNNVVVNGTKGSTTPQIRV